MANDKRRALRARLPDGEPNPVDLHVGSRLRLRRTLLGLSQEELGGAMGLTFQQIQKYERGANRISASRLFDLSRVLSVPVSFFFEDMPEPVQAQTPSQISGASNISLHFASLEGDPTPKRETLELARNYYRISNFSLRRQVYNLAKALAEASEQNEKII
jgi:Predicted transcriptional regulators